MSEQDAQDITQMMSRTSDVAIAQPKKSKFIWVVLACVIVGVGLGVVVYQQSIKPPAPTVKTTPKPTPATTAPTVAPTPPSLVPVPPQTNVVTPSSNAVTFPKAGKVRLYTDLNNIQLYMSLNIAGTPQSIIVPNKATSATTPMNYGDSSFNVTAGSTANFDAYLNNLSGPKMRGWIPPLDAQKKDCGVAVGSVQNNEAKLAYVQGKLAGESIFLYQCWDDNDNPGEFNDIYMIWTYVPTAGTSVSPSPSAAASTVASASPVASKSPSPSPSKSASPSPSASAKASVVPSPTLTPTPAASTRTVMPDTSEGTPVTGIFEVTMGTVSVGIVFLILGLFGLLVL